MLTPTLHGLVLAGGLSTRMGVDKATLVHPGSGKPLWQHCAERLGAWCQGVRVSCRADQIPLFPPSAPLLLDPVPPGDHGPANGLLAAHRHAPEAAWLVLAVDFPLVTPGAIRRLCEARSSGCAGTAYINGAGILEPLFAVWEPAGLEALEAAPAWGPRHVLASGPCKRLEPDDPRVLLNANTPEEWAASGMLACRT